MEGVKIACGQITWGRSVDREKVLAEIAAAGYEGAPAGRFSGGSAKEVLDLYERFGLKPAPGYMGLAWWDNAKHQELLDTAAAQAAFSRELGLTEIYVAANLTPERRAISGQVKRENAPTAQEFDVFANLINQIGQITLKEGVRICFHNHVGSHIETRFEIDELFKRVDRSLLFQGADIGHLAWAGDDIVQFTKDYADSILTLHIKDIAPKVLAEGIEKKWGYSDFSDHGIFAELGEGMVDFPAMFEELKKAQFKGWIVVETDVTQKASAFESAKISRDYLKSIGV